MGRLNVHEPGVAAAGGCTLMRRKEFPQTGEGRKSLLQRNRNRRCASTMKPKKDSENCSSSDRVFVASRGGDDRRKFLPDNFESLRLPSKREMPAFLIRCENDEKKKSLEEEGGRDQGM